MDTREVQIMKRTNDWSKQTFARLTVTPVRVTLKLRPEVSVAEEKRAIEIMKWVASQLQNITKSFRGRLFSIADESITMYNDRKTENQYIEIPPF